MITSATPHALRYWYGRINRAAFRGRLPKVEIKFVTAKDWLASTQRRCGSGREFTIRFNRRMMFSHTLCVATLAHEMVHIEHWGWGHTRRFENRVLKVIKKARLESFL